MGLNDKKKSAAYLQLEFGAVTTCLVSIDYVMEVADIKSSP